MSITIASMIDTPRTPTPSEQATPAHQTPFRLIPRWNLALGPRLIPRWTRLVVKAAPVVAKPSTELPEVSYGSWVTSSYDLLDGSEVIEDPDTLPGDLFDELFAPKPGNSKGPGG
jgi:hypothetical protein